MSITAQIIADSISTTGDRLTTYVLTFPRWILAELNTHRALSRNVASSRAIPIETMIQQVLSNPATPSFWGKNQSGMQSKEELDDATPKLRYASDEFGNVCDYHATDKEFAKRLWLVARDRAVASAKELSAAGLHKQYVNRTIENFMYVKAILSGTEFTNFFALRAHPDAQPEIQELAYKMLDAYNASEPKSLNVGEWHIPFGDKIDEDRLFDAVNGTAAFNEYYNDPDSIRHKISIARCARISYLNHEGKDDYAADIKLCDRLFGSVPRHLSPTEHVAQCTGERAFIGNFRGWKQYRYTFEDQSLDDPRVVRKVWKGAATS